MDGKIPASAQPQRIVLCMVILNAFTTPLMLSAANVAIPSIARDLHLDAVTASWVPMIYLLASAAFVLIFGRLADIFGHKRIFLTGTAGVILSSILAACASGSLVLLVARFLQGTSAAMLYATQVAIVSSVFPPKQRGRAIGAIVSAVYMGLTCGPLIGGFLVELYGWRISFLFYIPLAVTVLLIGFFKAGTHLHAGDRGVFHISSAVLYSLSVFLLCSGVLMLPAVPGLLCLSFGLLSAYAFIRSQQRSAAPIFDVGLFRGNRVFAFSCYASLIIYSATFANVFLISFYLQHIKALSATYAGVIMMVQPLTMAVFSPFVGYFSDRIRPGLLTSAGMCLTAAGLFSLSMLEANSTMYYLVFALVLSGFGFALFSSPNASAIMGSVKKDRYGSASGVLATTRLLGQMLSMTLVTLIFALVIGHVEITAAVYQALQQAIGLCFLAAGGLCVLGLIFSVGSGRDHLRDSDDINKH